jgi:O-antigen/teichoic acid export membrane protein
MGQKGIHPLAPGFTEPNNPARHLPAGSLLERVVRFLPALLQLACLLVLCRLLLPTSFGAYGLAFAITTFLSLLGTSWIEIPQTALASEPRHAGCPARLISTSTILALASSLLLSLLGLGLLFVLRRTLAPEFALALRTGLLSLPCLALFCPIGLTDAGRFRFLRRFVPALGMLLGVLLVRLFRLDSSALLAGTGIVAGVAVLLSLNRLEAATPRGFSLPIARRLAQTGLPLMLPALCWTLIAFSDRVVVFLLYGAGGTGVYSLGWALADRLLFLILVLLVNADAHELARGYSRRGPTGSLAALNRRIASLLRVSVPAILMLFAVGPDATRFVLPSAWHNSFGVLPWLALSTAGFAFSRYALVPLLTGGGLARYRKLMLSAAAANVVLALLLVPMLGLGGAALATAIAVLMTCARLVRAGREVGVWVFPARLLVIPVLAGSAMLGAQFALKHLLVLNVGTLLLRVFSGAVVCWVACLLADRVVASDLPSQLGHFWRRGATGFLRPFGIRLGADA